MIEWVELQTTVLSLLNKQQLQSLGIKEQYIFFMLGLAGVMACFFMLRPVLKLLIILRWETIITYLVSSLFFLVLLGTFLIAENNTAAFLKGEDFAVTILAVILFGGVLIVFQTFRMVAASIHKRKSKAS